MGLHWQGKGEGQVSCLLPIGGGTEGAVAVAAARGWQRRLAMHPTLRLCSRNVDCCKATKEALQGWAAPEPRFTSSLPSRPPGPRVVTTMQVAGS